MSDTKEPDTKQKVTDAAKRVRNKLGKFGKKALDKLPSTGLKVGAFAVGMAALAPEEVHAENQIREDTTKTWSLTEGGIRSTGVNESNTVNLSGKPVTTAQLQAQTQTRTQVQASTGDPDIDFLNSLTPQQFEIFQNLNEYAQSIILEYQYVPADREYQIGLNPTGKASTQGSSDYAAIVFDPYGDYLAIPTAAGYYSGSSTNATLLTNRSYTGKQLKNSRSKGDGPYKRYKNRQYTNNPNPRWKQAVNKVRRATKISREIRQGVKGLDTEIRKIERDAKKFLHKKDPYQGKSKPHKRDKDLLNGGNYLGNGGGGYYQH